MQFSFSTVWAYGYLLYDGGVVVEKTVLIIDDDEKLSKMLAFLFMAKGFKVESANSGSAAFEVLERIKPSVLILDVMVPGMDGFEVCEKVKDDPSLKGIPVIILSALSSDKNREKSISLGAYAYFEKPFKSAELVSKAVEAIEAA